MTDPGSPTFTLREGSPAVGVVVPVYNKSDFIEETLRSVFAQTYHNMELVVVDDGSSDDSVATVERVLEGTCGRLVAVENGGVSRARNLGFQEVRDRVEYLLFLDADDLLEPHALSTLVSYMESNPQVVATYTTSNLIDEHSVLMGREPYQTRWKPFRLGRRAIPEHEPRMSLASVYARFQLLPSGTLIRRSAFERTAGWDSALCRPARPFHAEDKDMATQLGLLGEIHYFAEPLYRYRILPTPHRLTMYDGLKELDQKWWNAPLRRPVQREVPTGNPVRRQGGNARRGPGVGQLVASRRRGAVRRCHPEPRGIHSALADDANPTTSCRAAEWVVAAAG